MWWGRKMFGTWNSIFGSYWCINVFGKLYQSDIAFAVNLLARFSAKPTKRHWNGVKHILQYIKGIEDLGLFYKVGEDNNIKGYVDAGNLSDLHKGKSQIG